MYLQKDLKTSMLLQISPNFYISQHHTTVWGYQQRVRPTESKVDA
jgi:hypothetical protein